MQRSDIDLSNIEWWARPISEREDAFRVLREGDGITFWKEPEIDLPAGPGYYAVTHHADIVEISRRANHFCSGKGTNIIDMPQEFLEFFGSMINMDDPRHARMRKIVSRAFTPKMLASMMADVEEVTAGIVDGVCEKGSCDFVTEIAALVPLRIIVDLMGIPRSQEQFIFDRTNVILGFTDPEYVESEEMGVVLASLLGAGSELAALVGELGADRIKNPQNDLTTALVTAEVDGDHLTPEELASFFILLVAAGNETTRNAIAHGLHALTEHPDERERWRSDFEGLAPTAVEEIVRWATPVIHFRRTVTEDGVRLRDREFKEGEKVILFYNSANRDESHFADDPHRFDLGRTPNDHVGFGGPGPHFCLGAHLARREITATFRELFARLPDIHAVRPPEHLRSNFINGIKHLDAEFTPVAPRPPG